MSKTTGFKPPYPTGRGYAKVEDLQPHPKNREIYTDRENDDLVERIEKHGFKESQRLLICVDGTIISGHRRWDAAKQTDTERVPVEVVDIEPDSNEAVLELLTANDYREKTPAEKVNEAEAWEEIEREKAKQRMKNPTENLPEGEKGETREKAAEKVGISGKTYEKGKKVKEQAEQGDETAQEEWDKLESDEQSIHGAYTNVKDTQSNTDKEQTENETESNVNDDEKSESNDIEQFTSQETDEWSSPKELVQPFNEDIGGFDLDPCSGAEQSPFATDVYTKDDDGLTQDWYGNVWVNPPYSQMDDWVTKAIRESQRKAVDRIVFLCKGDSSTDWWQNAVKYVSSITAIDRRLQFGTGDNSAPFPSHVLVFGQSEPLIESLQEQGTVLTVGWGDRNG